MATNVAREHLGVSVRGPRVGWALGGLSALALAAIVVAAVAVMFQAPTEWEDAGTISPIYTRDEITVLRLVERGVIPRDILDTEPLRTKQLVAEGLVPRATLAARLFPVAPLYCAKEEAVVAGVADGVIPGEALRGEPFRTKRLINQGLIPREAAVPC
jgi:hypothetical protein